MPRVAAIYTVPSVLATFPDLIRATIPGAEVSNTLDDFLTTDPIARGEFTRNNLNRLHAFFRCAEMAGADVIVVTCSTLTPPTEILRPLVSTPIITIDGPMLKQAVALGSSITLMATSPSTVEPAQIGLTREAERQGKKISVKVMVNEKAFNAIRNLDKEQHDRLVLEQAAGVKGSDVIVLAQASMAHLEEEVQKATGITTLSSPKLCMEELKKVLG